MVPFLIQCLLEGLHLELYALRRTGAQRCELNDFSGYEEESAHFSELPISPAAQDSWPPNYKGVRPVASRGTGGLFCFGKSSQVPKLLSSVFLKSKNPLLGV